MKNLRQILICSFLFFPSLMIAQQNQRFIGSWMGKLNVGAIQLRLGINLSLDNSNKVIALLDSPDQNTFGIKTDSTFIAGDKITIKASKLMASYE